ncbi:MAG: type secretion protein Rhs [Bacteroidetes bacterium]|nr:type secretion protein Rhs [Bacteroidota bacterium]
MIHRSTSWSAPYTFSGKEKDVETGFVYFVARYYESGLSIWLTVDPMSDKYTSISPYNYCTNNPVIMNDPDGNDPIFSIYGKITVGINGYNIGCQLYYTNGNDTWYRHYCQNIFAHEFFKIQRGFLMTNNLWFPVLNYSTNQNNNFTLWDN